MGLLGRQDNYRKHSEWSTRWPAELLAGADPYEVGLGWVWWRFECLYPGCGHWSAWCVSDASCENAAESHTTKEHRELPVEERTSG